MGSRLRAFLAELKRRKVYGVAVVYAVVGWLVIEVAVTTFPLLFLPDWLARAVVVLVLLGFPVSLVIAWAFERTPGGLRRTDEVRGSGQPGVREKAASPETPPAGEAERFERPTLRPRSRRAMVGLFVAGLVVAAAGYLAVARLQGFSEGPTDGPSGRPSATGPVSAADAGAAGSPVAAPGAAHLQLVLPPGVSLPLDADYPLLAVSPDGSRIVFVGEEDGRRRLYSRRLTDAESRPIAGTEGALAPFFSPDGEWIVYLSDWMLFKVATAGGRPVPIHGVTGQGVARGAAWVSDSALVYSASANSGLLRGAVPGHGVGANSDWELLTSASMPVAWPSRVSGRPEVVFARSAAGDIDESDVALFSLESGETRTLINGAISPRFSPTGHLLFARDEVLHAVGYDPVEAETTGRERELVRGVAAGGFDVSHYAVGGNVLAYVAGEAIPREFELVWVDRDGEVIGTLHEGRSYQDPRIAPDGGRVAVTITEGPNLDVWVLDLARNTLQPLTRHPGEDFGAVWHPDHLSLALSSEIGEDRGDNGPALAWIPELGGPTEPLTFTPEPGAWEFPTSWTPDGRSILVTTRRDGRSADIALFTLDGDGELAPVLDTAAEELGGTIAPDGRWLAYVSDRSGRDEIWIRPFPGTGRAIQVSSDGGREPVWSRDSRELFYRSGLDMMVVDVPPGATPDLSRPRSLFSGRFEPTLFGGEIANFDVTADGDRFLMVRRKKTVQPTVIDIVLNWPAVLLPARGGRPQ